jgi:hypothetical protein
MNTLALPSPDELRERIEACEQELRALKRLLRMAQYATDAEAAARRREGSTAPEPDGGKHAS